MAPQLQGKLSRPQNMLESRCHEELDWVNIGRAKPQVAGALGFIGARLVDQTGAAAGRADASGLV